MIDLQFDAPSEKQKLFLLERHRHVAFGGARGGGKSWAIRLKAVLMCCNYAGITCMIVRKSYPELLANHAIPLREMLKCGSPQAAAAYNSSDKTFLFATGSRIILRYCDAEKDVDRFQGLEVDVLFLDEATQLSEMQMKKINACVRGTNGFPKRTYYTCNPGGQGHGYIKRLFIDKKYERGENPADYSFIQSLVTDNPALMAADPDYIHQLEALPEKLRKAWLDGSWDIFEGQFFEDFRDDPQHYADRRWTHVIDPIPIPQSWKIYQSYDFGYSKPFSFQWWAVDQDNRAYLIVELYGCTKEPNEGVKWIAEEQFKKVKDIEATHPLLKGRRIVDRIADPAIWDGSRGESIQETAAKNQIYFSKGDNARVAGWLQMHYRFSFDENGIPMMYIFNTCRQFIRTIPLMVYSETIPEDLNTDLEDHIADSTRYFCMARVISPRTTAEKHELEFDPLDLDGKKKKADEYTYINV